MRRTALFLSLAAALALPGLADGHGGKHKGAHFTAPARQACKSEKQADPAAFKTKYGNKNGKHAFRRCVRRHVRNAAHTCRAERKQDKAAFKTKYGNKNGKHAFRRCVRQHESDPVS